MGKLKEGRNIAILRERGTWIYRGTRDMAILRERWDMAILRNGAHGNTEERGTWLY